MKKISHPHGNQPLDASGFSNMLRSIFGLLGNHFLYCLAVNDYIFYFERCFSDDEHEDEKHRQDQYK